MQRLLLVAGAEVTAAGLGVDHGLLVVVDQGEARGQGDCPRRQTKRDCGNTWCKADIRDADLAGNPPAPDLAEHIVGLLEETNRGVALHQGDARQRLVVGSSK